MKGQLPKLRWAILVGVAIAGISAIALTPAVVRAQAAQAPRDLQIVAHEDDDVIFMNPDIRNDIKAGHTVRTVFVTAGNVCPDGKGTCAPMGPFDTDTKYWQSRERGALAAYATMAGKVNVQLSGTEGYDFFHDPADYSGTTCTPGKDPGNDGGQGCLYDFSTITVPGSCGACKVDVWTLRGTPRAGQVSVVFLRVSAADGGSNIFPLEKLWQGKVSTLTTVGAIGTGYANATDDTLTCTAGSGANPTGCRTYTTAQLTTLVIGIMKQFKPTHVRLQDPSGSDYTDQGYDHTDHLHAARIGLNAYWDYVDSGPAVTPGLVLYRGYYTTNAPHIPVNVTGAAMAAKQAALNNNCVFDPATGGIGCYSDTWGPWKYALYAMRLKPGAISNGTLLTSGQPGCLTPVSGSRVTVTACGTSPRSWSFDSHNHLETTTKSGTICLTAGTTVGAVNNVTVAPCTAGSSHWLYLSNGMLISDNSKVLRAATDGSLQSVDLFTYDPNLDAGGVGNLPVIDLTDLGYRWMANAVPVGP